MEYKHLVKLFEFISLTSTLKKEIKIRILFY